MGVITWTAVRLVPDVVSAPFSVSPVVPLPVEMALTKVSLPPWPVVVVRYRGSAVAPFVPAGRILSSAPPGSRASSGVMVVVVDGELPLLYPVVVVMPELGGIVLVLMLLGLEVELMRSLCSCAPVIVWMWVCCGRRLLADWLLEVKCDRLVLLLMLLLLPPVVRCVWFDCGCTLAGVLSSMVASPLGAC